MTTTDRQIASEKKSKPASSLHRRTHLSACDTRSQQPNKDVFYFRLCFRMQGRENERIFKNVSWMMP